MTAGDFYFVPSHQMFSGGTVSGGAATSYLDEWLTDGRPGRPTRATSGSPSWTIGNAALDVNFVAVTDHNIDAARNIVFGGGITKTIVGPTLPPNGITLNPWGTLTLVAGVTSVTLGITSNTADVIIGEVIIGKYSTLERSLGVGAKVRTFYEVVRHDAEFDSLMPHDKAITHRVLTGSNIYTDSGLQAILDWYDATRGGTRPTLIVPNSNVQDAWLVEMKAPDVVVLGNNRNDVSFEFVEYRRSRW